MHRRGTWLAALALAGGTTMASGYESAFPQTAAGAAEVKTLPAARVLVAHEGGAYFDRANPLFRRLFRYIRENEVPMTVPVTADVSDAAMVFFVGASQSGKALADGDGVQVVEKPARTVASLGGRGSYTRANFESAVRELRAWLAARTDVREAGEPYAVYWNGPFVPGFLKRYEVHIPVAPASP
jgi:DNA gyrase inhibitor GyrI